MSRSAQQMRQQQKQQLLAQQQQIADNEAAAAAAEMFDLFCVATTMRQVLGLHRNMCDILGLRPAPLNEFYPKLKAKVRSWKAQALWKKFDARAAHRAYAKGTACTGSRVLVIGAGPCGLRTAIEAQLLGAKVLVVEKRDRISRNNVLHLWPFVITDLRNLGAKKFYGKFCAGSIDHISIRQIQCILLKVALLLGVEVHEGVSFERAIEPSGDGCGWRASVLPADHAVSHYEFDVLIGADGKRNTLEGFKRKEFRGKLAIAITANFINKKTEAEAKVEEISGVAFIFNQSFFKELYQTTGIDLENIVYYKDETHYFVMTAKKHSLIDKGVIMQDFADPAELLAPSNVNTEKLLDYAREAANFSTKYQMPNLEFAVNHYGKPDVAMFDFTSMFAAETSCRVIVRKGFRLMQCLVGDSLLEPFWPTGSGCARGFLSSMDAAYALKLWSNPRNSILGVLAQRESIYRLLNQTTPENLQRDIGSYTVDPATRYPNLNRTSVNAWQVKHLIDTDDKAILEQTFMDTNALQTTQVDTPVRRKRRSGDSTPLSTVLLRWICAQLREYEFTKDLKEAADIFTNGKVLCALINRYRPDLVDFNVVKDLTAIECNERAFKILDKELHIPRVMSGKDSIQINNVDAKIWLSYLEQICEAFRGEVPHVKHPKMDFTELREKHRMHYTHAQPDFSKLLQITSNKQTKSKSPLNAVDVPQNAQRRSVLNEEHVKRQRAAAGAGGGSGVVAAAGASGLSHQAQNETPRRAKKRRSAEKAANIEERQQRLKDIEQNRQDRQSRRRQQRYLQTQNFYKSLHMLHANTLLRESDENTPFEDYSIFLYRQQAPEFNDRVKELERKLLYPDRDRGDIPSALPRGTADEQFSDRIKSMEERMANPRAAHGNEKKPKDLMRAIGKIESSDWNVREIEKKIEQSRKTEVHGPKGREKVPKWSKEQFQARQKKMSKPARQESVEEKFKEIDQTLKNLDKQLKEGHMMEVGERGRNKVASIAGQFVKKDDSDDKNSTNNVIPKSSSKVALAFKKQAASEKCHFCRQTVYLMEKITAEGLILHRSCLKCHHCHTNLRPGGYAFDRDDPNGRFYCTQHYRLPAKAMPKPAVRKSGQRKSTQQQQQRQLQQQQEKQQTVAVLPGKENANEDPKTPEKLRIHADNVAQLDLLDRGQTPERIEFENTDAISDGGEPSEEHVIDENEWSGRNFLHESNNNSESELSSSDESDTESGSEMFEEAADSPIGAQTLQLVTDWIGKQNYSDSDDSDDFYDSSDGIADDGKDDTEGEEFKKARELRREEVRLLPLPPNLPTDTETEVQTESESTSPDEVEMNSATEISTDSEFDNDELARDAPKIFIDDTHIRKPTKVQIKTTVIESTAGHRFNPATNVHSKVGGGSYLAKYQVNPPQPQFKPLVQVDPTLLTNTRNPLQNPRPGDYLLNKTASTEGIASKKSLELKKRYLLGEPQNGNKIQKSGSTSVLDSRIRTFQSNISECQKLLNPSSGGGGITPSMRTFLERTKLNENANAANNDLMRSATTNILNELKVEITIQKASSTASTDNEKENVFVNSKNELNKGMEYSDTINIALLDNSLNKNSSPTTPTNKEIVTIETIDLTTPEKCDKDEIIDLITPEKSPTILDFKEVQKVNSKKNETELLAATKADSNKLMTDSGCESPLKSEHTIVEEIQKPDVSIDAKQNVPDILGHVELCTPSSEKQELRGDRERLLSNSGDEEKMDSPEKPDGQFENVALQIKVPNIPWHTRNKNNVSSTTPNSSWSSTTSTSTSIEDLQHYILDSTTSPDTNNTMNGGMTVAVPRVEVHDSTGALMQIDSLMIIDGKYIGDPEDLKYMELPEGVIIESPPETAIVKTTVLGDEEETEQDNEPITATPEPVEQLTIIERTTSAEEEFTKLAAEIDAQETTPLTELPPAPPLPETAPPKINVTNLKFDTKNENKIESLKNLPLILAQAEDLHTKAIKPLTLNLTLHAAAAANKSTAKQTTPTNSKFPTTPLTDNDKTPTAELLSRGSDSETEPTGTTGQVLTETELSDWTADDCISENFIDTEFVLNSNKGTIKRNKKHKRKSNNSSKMPSISADLKEIVVKTAPVVDIESMFNTMDIEDIEFMDTGSEGSCAEAYSATNTALLRNRGYMEFIDDPNMKGISLKKNSAPAQIVTKRDEKLGIDYIEQGACILDQQQSQDKQEAIASTPDMLKTPVNETIPTLEYGRRQSQTQMPSIMNQSLTDSSTLNDLEDDSLGGALTANSQSMNSKPTITTTTEESEALTVVTSPLDSSSSPKTQDSNVAAVIVKLASKDEDTPSSSDKNPKSSTCTPSTDSSSKSATPPLKLNEETMKASGAGGGNLSSNSSNSARIKGGPTLEEQLSYEEYVRALQQKVTQISTAGLRDSLDVRKQRRRSSKGEPAAPTVIEQTQQAQLKTPTAINDELPAYTLPGRETVMYAYNNSTSSNTTAHIPKVPEIPTLTSKLEEITKERTKQKDLIHDLVMDKLQSKKQLNAEKRLHRSRQRALLTSGGIGGGNGGYSSASSLSPTPKIATPITVADSNCTSKAHYHVSTASPIASGSSPSKYVGLGSQDENKQPKIPTYVSAYKSSTQIPPPSYRTQRPFSAHIESTQSPLELYAGIPKLNKTSSFSSVPPPTEAHKPMVNSVATTPKTAEKFASSTSTENLRSEARARARLKSNTELGLSPEEKMNLLRQRLYAEHCAGGNKMAPSLSGKTTATTSKPQAFKTPREQKMSMSKSVNDLAYISTNMRTTSPHHDHPADKNSNTKATVKIAAADFTSDPNLLLSSISSQVTEDPRFAAKTKTNRRAKDPERRKSLIQSISSLFHKDKKQKNHEQDVATIGAANSAQAERPGTSGSNTTTASGSVDGVLSLFRISPKSKEKSKDKDGGMKSSPTKSNPHERSNSQDCMLDTHNNKKQQQQQTSKLHNKKQTNQAATTATKTQTSNAFSSSSPQLYIHRPSYANNASDEQAPPPIPPLPLHYQRSDDESYATETREQKRQRAISKAVRQAELKRLRIAQEIQREQEEIEVQLKELEARGVLIEKALRGEEQTIENSDHTNNIGNNDEKLLKELLEIWRNITQLKKRDEELGIRQQELQLEHRHAQLKEELNLRLSCNKLDKSSADVAAEGAILNEMLEIVAKRAALRPTVSSADLTQPSNDFMPSTSSLAVSNAKTAAGDMDITINARGLAQNQDINESNI